MREAPELHPTTPEQVSFNIAGWLVDRRFSEVVVLFDAALAGALPEATLAEAWTQTTGPMGPLRET